MQQHFPLNPSTGLEDASQLPWLNGNPSTGTSGSFPGFGLFVEPMYELLNAIAGSGETAGSDLTQLLQALSRGIYVGSFGGTANALTAAVPPLIGPSGAVSVPSLTAGMGFTGVVGTTNTGPATITLSGFTAAPGAVNLLADDGKPLAAGDLVTGTLAQIVFDGTAFRMRSLSASMVKNRLGSPTVVPFTTPGTSTWTVPAGVFRVYGTVIGGGGGGSGSSGSGSTSGGGGGAGGTASGWFAVTPGQVLTIVVGAAGGGTAYAISSGAGGTSSIGTVLQATGGGGTGGYGACAGGQGGVGSGSAATTTLVGGAGNDGNPSTVGSPGGQGGSSSLGGGGRTATTAASITNGQAPGSGGGGLYTTSTGNGGNGAPGAVYLTYNA